MANDVHSRRGVLLDRDGVINVEINLLNHIGQLELIPGAARAIGRLNHLGLPVVVITNQSVIARGLCTEEQVDDIHRSLNGILSKEGARVDAFYYCPHHPQATLQQYRKICPDRKPGTGLLEKAAAELALDLSNSYFVGDQTIDVMAGRLAGCRTFLVRTGYGGRDALCPVMADSVCDDLPCAVSEIERLIRGEMGA